MIDYGKGKPHTLCHHRWRLTMGRAGPTLSTTTAGDRGRPHSLCHHRWRHYGKGKPHTLCHHRWRQGQAPVGPLSGPERYWSTPQQRYWVSSEKMSKPKEESRGTIRPLSPLTGRSALTGIGHSYDQMFALKYNAITHEITSASHSATTAGD